MRLYGQALLVYSPSVVKPFTSGLSVSDFAATLQAGMRPVALVQGCCVMGWHWYGKGSPYLRPRILSGDRGGDVLSTYACPHVSPLLPGHWSWGQNFEQTWKSTAWREGFDAAYGRMMDEAVRAGAHGVVGVTDSCADQAESGLREMLVLGTAVVVEDAEPPSTPWSCRLKGQALGKLIESGFWPVSTVAAMASVRSWAVCATKMLMEGDYDELANTPNRVKAGSPIAQLADADMQARRVARDRLKAAVDPEAAFGVDLRVTRREVRKGDLEVECTLRGTRVTHREHTRPAPPVAVVGLQ